VHYLRCVTFTFALNCLGEVCGSSEIDGIEGYWYKRSCKQVFESYMAVANTKSCSIGYNVSCWRTLWNFHSRRCNVEHCLVCLLITYSVFLCQGSYLAVRKWNRTRIRPVHVLVKGKLESKIAYTTFWSTVFVGVSGVRILVVYLFHGASPFSRQISILRWAETYSVQLNLLFNPLLNWYRNRRFRKVTLELLRCRNRPATRTSRHTRQRPYSVIARHCKASMQAKRRWSIKVRISRCYDVFTHLSAEAEWGSEGKTHVSSIEGSKRPDIPTPVGTT